MRTTLNWRHGHGGRSRPAAATRATSARTRGRVGGPRFVTAPVFLSLLIVATAACSSAASESIAYVDFAQRTPLPDIEATEPAPLRVAVAAIISAEGTARSYTALADYIGESIGRPVELVQRRTYAEVNDLIESGDVHLAFVCTSAYVAGHDDFGLELLAAPQIHRTTVYHSDLIVPATSAAEGIEDLRGRVFAFTDPMSTSGRIYPTSLLEGFGETPETFFARTFFTYSHDKAIYSVADGLADGAAVDSLVLEYAIARDPAIADQVKVIRRSPPFGIPPVVVPPELPEHQKSILRQLLLDMHTDESGRRLLADLGIDRFVSVEDELYDDVRDLTLATKSVP